jgi:hypothetical protein
MAVLNRLWRTKHKIARMRLSCVLLACTMPGLAISDDARPLRPSLNAQPGHAIQQGDGIDRASTMSVQGVQAIGRQPGNARQGSELQARARTTLPSIDLMTDEPDLMAKPVSYVVFDQPLDIVVQEVGRLAGYAVSTTRDVRGKVPSGRMKGSLGEVMQKLKVSHGLVTMRDGTRLFVASDSESQVRYIKVGTEAPTRVREVLQSLKVDDLDSRVKVDESAGLVQINAPPSISERIETILVNAAKSTAPGSTGHSLRQTQP